MTHSEKVSNNKKIKVKKIWKSVAFHDIFKTFPFVHASKDIIGKMFLSEKSKGIVLANINFAQNDHPDCFELHVLDKKDSYVVHLHRLFRTYFNASKMTSFFLRKMLRELMSAMFWWCYDMKNTQNKTVFAFTQN